MKNTLVIRPFLEESLNVLGDIEGYRLVYAQQPTARQLSEAEVILGNPSMEQLAQTEHLEWIQSASAGIDLYAKNKEKFPTGVLLTNTSGAFGQSISEFCLTMVLMLYKKTELFRDNQQHCLWKDEGRQDSPVGKNLLILGAGDIGCATARLFRTFGCHITGVRRVPRAVPKEFDAMITLNELDEALPKADIVICSLPDTPATRGLLDGRRLGLLKKDAVLVNVGRGNLIDCMALARQLEEGRLWGVALDVTDPEPLPADHPLWKCKNAVLTPHATGGSFGHLRATEDFIYRLTRENMERYREGKPLRNRADLDIGYRATDGEH